MLFHPGCSTPAPVAAAQALARADPDRSLSMSNLLVIEDWTQSWTGQDFADISPPLTSETRRVSTSLRQFTKLRQQDGERARIDIHGEILSCTRPPISEQLHVKRAVM